MSIISERQVKPAAPAPPSGGYLAYALVISYAAMISLAIVVNFVPVFLTTLQIEFGGLTNEQLGRVGGVTFVGLVVGILFTGPLADRFGARSCAVAGNLLIGAGLLALGFSQNYGMLLAAVFTMGLGAGVLDMVLSPIVGALQPNRRTVAMNWLHSFYCLGAVAVVLAGTLALRAGIGMRHVALALIPLPVIVGAAFARLRLPPLVPDDGERTDLRSLLGQPVFLVSLVAIFLAGVAELGLAQWLPAYAEATLGFSKEVGGTALVGFSLAMALGRMFVGVAGARFSAITLMLTGCCASTALFVVACFAPRPGVALAACIAVGFTGSALWPSMLALAADRFPRGGATMYGMLAAFGNMGGIFMPWGVGLIADHAGMRLGLSSATLCPLLMIACLMWIRHRTRPPGGQAAE